MAREKGVVSRSAAVRNAHNDSVPTLLTITDAARELGIARGTLHKLLDAGAIGYVRVMADRKIPATELTRWIDCNTIKAGKQ